MKKVLMLAALILGTTAMVNAETLPVKQATAKTTALGKHKKAKLARKAKRMEAKKVESTNK